MKVAKHHVYAATTYTINRLLAYHILEFTVNHNIIPYVCTYIGNCQPLDNIINGSIACFVTPSNEDICNITCDKGYVLVGSDTRTCLINGSWSGTDGLCQLGNTLL